MNVRTRGYEGLLEHREVLVSLCGAVLLQAVKDRATLERKGSLRRRGSSANTSERCQHIQELDEWFQGRTCSELCRVIGIAPDFGCVDWSKVRVGHVYRGQGYGA